MVGLRGFEPPTLCTPCKCASQTALQPEIGAQSVRPAPFFVKLFFPSETRSRSASRERFCRRFLPEFRRRKSPIFRPEKSVPATAIRAGTAETAAKAHAEARRKRAVSPQRIKHGATPRVDRRKKKDMPVRLSEAWRERSVPEMAGFHRVLRTKQFADNFFRRTGPFPRSGAHSASAGKIFSNESNSLSARISRICASVMSKR